LSGLLLVTIGVRPGKDETPARGGEHLRLGFRIHAQQRDCLLFLLQA
jgi:hypothetical protein